MSQRRLSHSVDLLRLRNEGYEVSILGGHLVVTHVPYLTAGGTVDYGTLVSTLNFADDTTIAPETHTISFAGTVPCDATGARLEALINADFAQEHAPGLKTNFMFSSKPIPSGQYVDYYEKVTTYVSILTQHAQTVDPTATAKTFAPTLDDDEDAVFTYADTATSRAGIVAISAKLALERIAIIGLGGTGAYILDLLAKTPAREIHLFDGDVFHQHNAFRAPGAATLQELQNSPFKVDYFASRYSPMRHGIVAHPTRVTSENLAELDTMHFAFVAVDDGPSKRTIITHLEAHGIDFIDVGMGIIEVDGHLGGIVRTTTSRNTPTSRAAARTRISFADDANNEYATNIQIADLNALNAAIAVIAFKKKMGFYLDLEPTDFSAFTIDTNRLAIEDPA